MEAGHPFEGLFRSEDLGRDAYRSRLFGLFSEEVVRHWCANDRSPYRNLGRPTLWSGTAYATLDFTLQSRTSHACYVAEQKAEMAWSGYQFLRLADAWQLTHHTGKRAFDWLLDFAKDSRSHSVRVNGRPLEASGAILIWGAITAAGREAVIEAYGFADVLSLEAMLDDLREWADPSWRAMVNELREWSVGLFDGLL